MSKKPISVSMKVAFLGDPKVGKSNFIKNYAGEGSVTKDKKEKGPHFVFLNRLENYEFKINIYEYSDTEKHSSVIKDCQCVFILFDMTKREAFERLLDNWIIFVRDTSGYKGKIIILGNYNNEKDFLTTDEDEVKELIEVCDINGEFHRIGIKTNEEKKELIKGFINAACSQYVQGKKKSRRLLNFLNVLYFIFIKYIKYN